VCVCVCVSHSLNSDFLLVFSEHAVQFNLFALVLN